MGGKGREEYTSAGGGGFNGGGGHADGHGALSFQYGDTDGSQYDPLRHHPGPANKSDHLSRDHNHDHPKSGTSYTSHTAGSSHSQHRRDQSHESCGSDTPVTAASSGDAADHHSFSVVAGIADRLGNAHSTGTGTIAAGEARMIEEDDDGLSPQQPGNDNENENVYDDDDGGLHFTMGSLGLDDDDDDSNDVNTDDNENTGNTRSAAAVDNDDDNEDFSPF